MISTLFQSFGIAVNRSATQVASIIITAILGLYSIQVLAEFSLALTFAAILFAIVTTVQMGTQAELGKRFAEKNISKMFDLFKSTLIVVNIVACIIAVAIWILPNPFSSAGDVELARQAMKTLKILVLSLPLVATLTTITFLLESTGKTKKVVFLRTAQVFLQVGFIVFFVWFKEKGWLNLEVSASHIAIMYLLSDLCMLMIGIMLLFMHIRREFRTYPQIETKSNISKSMIYEVTRLGSPVMVGMIGQRMLFYCYANYIASLGILQMSSFSILNSVIFFFQIPLMGVAHLMTIKIGNSLGEKRHLGLQKTFLAFIKLFTLELCVIGFVFYCLLPLILPQMTDDIEILQLLNSLQWIIMVYFVMNAALTFCMSGLRGYSDTLTPQLMILAILSLGVIAIYLISPATLGISGILLIFSIAGLIAAFFLFKRMVTMQKNEIAILQIEERGQIYR
ncbi:MATE family efflux transporter [Candidatus Berkiella aquae]|uniref:Multidrug efflux protein n=1 Tax=Candidatus Berkiella aquae TaxID=295108 RepID=A0A0Q9YRL8_9GAMM|nr:MATE family efflux transporter [Candidatus Berkiella aquae]MCS5709873.1 hypothetical protein [Candidatus Berkiella aquae]